MGCAVEKHPDQTRAAPLQELQIAAMTIIVFQYFGPHLITMPKHRLAKVTLPDRSMVELNDHAVR